MIINKLNTNRLTLLFLAIAIGCLPISTAIVNICFYIFLSLSVYGTLKDRLLLISVNKYFSRYLICSIAFFFYATLSLIWSTDLSVRPLIRYAEFFLLPFSVIILSVQKSIFFYRYTFIFLVSVLALAILSGLIYFLPNVSDLLLSTGIKFGDRSNPTIVRAHITYSIFIAFGVVISYLFFHTSKNKSRWFYFIACLYLTWVLFFLIQGRTGQLIFLVIVSFLALKNKSLWIPLGLIGLVSIFFLQESSFYLRYQQGFYEVFSWFEGSRNLPTSMGLRFDFYWNSWQIFLLKPLFGYGLGTFPSVYEAWAVSHNFSNASNPHNQYLLFLVELGLVGTLLWLGTLFTLWRCACGLDENNKLWLEVIILTYMVACLFNSMFLDSAEGIFFAISTSIAFFGFNQKQSTQ